MIVTQGQHEIAGEKHKHASQFVAQYCSQESVYIGFITSQRNKSLASSCSPVRQVGPASVSRAASAASVLRRASPAAERLDPSVVCDGLNRRKTAACVCARMSPRQITSIARPTE